MLQLLFDQLLTRPADQPRHATLIDEDPVKSDRPRSGVSPSDQPAYSTLFSAARTQFPQDLFAEKQNNRRQEQASRCEARRHRVILRCDRRRCTMNLRSVSEQEFAAAEHAPEDIFEQRPSFLLWCRTQHCQQFFTFPILR